MRAYPVAARAVRLFNESLWFLLFLMLPLTSLPLMAKFKVSSMVAPPSVLILFLLVLFWLIPYLLKSGRLPMQSLPLVGLGLVGLISSLVAFFSPVPPFRENRLLQGEIEAFITLAIGICFFLTVSVWAQSRQKLQFALRIINWTGLVILLWSLVQAYFWRKLGHYPQWVWDIQSIFSSGRLFETRVTGLAFEPSWFAHQLNMLYLPFWLAATVTGGTAHARRLWKISLENILLLLGAFVLFISLSRVGLLAFLMMAALLVFYANVRLVQWAQRKIITGTAQKRSPSQVKRFVLTLIFSLVLIALYVGAMLLVGFGLSKVDYRMAQLFDLEVLKEGSFVQYANRLVFAERIVFWQAGWGVFNNHPLLGVGLGNAGFYFHDTLSNYSWALTEVRTVMYQWASVPNIKNLWIRLLAETGLVGFSLLLGWYFLLWQSARLIRSCQEPFVRMIGWAGSFVLVGLVIEGFSVDTFALPYFWVSLGLLTAACQMVRRSMSETRQQEVIRFRPSGGKDEQQ